MRRYRVWIEQINAQVLIVSARTPEEAESKAQRKARPALSDMQVTDIVDVTPKARTQ